MPEVAWEGLVIILYILGKPQAHLLQIRRAGSLASLLAHLGKDWEKYSRENRYNSYNN